MNYWLMKSEPQVYSITDLQNEGQTIWDGIRNYQARNFMRQMQKGDLVFFYHSNTNNPGIVGLMGIVKNNVIDPTQFECNSPYYDFRASRESPRWQTVIVELIEVFKTIISLEKLKNEFSSDEFILLRKGNRLSVMPVEERIALKILDLKLPSS